MPTNNDNHNFIAKQEHHETYRAKKVINYVDDGTGTNTLSTQDLYAKPFLQAVAEGKVAGHSIVTKFGYNPDIDGPEEDLWAAGGSLTYLTTASTFRIKAGGNAADTVAGTGAREVTIIYLDANYVEQTETIATAGASASAETSTTGLRVIRAYCGACGSGGTNAGDITIEATTGGTTQAFIPATKGQTQQLFYTVPAGKTAYILSETFSLVKSASGGGGGAGSGTAGIHIYGWIRNYNESSTNNYNSWRQIYDVLVVESGGNPVDITETTPNPIAEKSDIRISATSDTTNMEINGRLHILLVDN